MKLEKRKIFLLVALIFVAICSFSVVGMTFALVDNDKEFTFDGSIKETYSVGETFEVPDAKFGEEIADFIVYLPDGTATYSNSFVLTQSGNYTVEYLLITEDDVISKNITFNVLSPMFSVVGDGYTEFRTLPNGLQGVYANLGKDATLAFNGIIDLTQISEADLLFKFMALPAVVGEADTNGLQIKLTDAYDENIYITLRYKRYTDGDEYDYKVSYVDCSFNDSDYVALTQSSKGAYVYAGTNYSRFVNSEKFGSNFIFSMTGGSNGVPNYGLSGIAYDETTGLIYAKRPSGTGFYSVLVSDVSNINLYGEVFPGFTDGKVKLSVTSFNMVKSSCGLFFSEVGGEAITAGNYNAFTSDFYPEINIDFGGNENSLPSAKQGRVYKLFNATAVDIIDGELDVTTEVYFGYENKNKIRVNVSDNSFVADRIGEYTIVYTATNSFGKTTQSFVKVKSIKGFEEIDLVLENEISYDSPVLVGEKIKLFDDYLIDNGFGSTELNVSIVLKEDNSISYELDSDFSFEPLYAGEYEIVYSFSDYIDVDEITKTLTVAENEIVRYELVKNFNKYFILNGKYDVNNVKAYSLASGSPIEVQVKAYYAANSSASETEIDDLLTVTTDEKVTLIYKPQVDFDVTPYTVEIPVVNTGYGTGTINKAKYFVPVKGDIDFVAKTDSVIAEFKQSDDGVVAFDFANVLARNEFSLSLESYLVNEVFNPFGRLNIYLEDRLNSNNVVKFSLYREGGVWLACVNDGNPLKFKDSWGVAGDLLDFNYDIYGKVFTLNSELAFNVPYFYQTETPIVFEEGLNLSVEFVDVNDCNGIKIKSVNGQTFNDSKYDGSAPIVDLEHYNHAGYKEINTLIEVGGFYAFDVLSPNTEVYLTVRGPNGVVKSIENILLNKVNAKDFYKFTLSDYGTYSVSVLCTDGENDRNRPCGNIIVEDNNPPIVNVTSKTNSGKVNETVKLATFTVNLNDGEYDYFFAIFDPNAKVTYTTDKTFIPKVKGEHKVHLFVFDTNYNLTELVYTIVVK